MFFRRKKKKQATDSRQLWLFSTKEMEGTAEGTSELLGSEEYAGCAVDGGDHDEASHCAVMDTVVPEQEGMAMTPSDEEREGAENKRDASSVVDNRHEADPTLLLHSMHDAILRLSAMPPDEMRLVALESATLAQAGIRTDHSYQLQSLHGEQLSGYDFIATYYVSFVRSFPSMLDKVDLPFSTIYEEALSLGI